MPFTKKQLRVKSGIDVRSEDDIRKQEFRNINELVTKAALIEKKLYCVVKTNDSILVEMIRKEYPDSSITVKGEYVTINWAEPEDIQNIKNQIQQLENQLKPMMKRIEELREWESKMIMNGGLAMMGPNDEKRAYEFNAHMTQHKIRTLKSRFIEL